MEPPTVWYIFIWCGCQYPIDRSQNNRSWKPELAVKGLSSVDSVLRVSYSTSRYRWPLAYEVRDKPCLPILHLLAAGNSDYTYETFRYIQRETTASCFVLRRWYILWLAWDLATEEEVLKRRRRAMGWNLSWLEWGNLPGRLWSKRYSFVLLQPVVGICRSPLALRDPQSFTFS